MRFVPLVLFLLFAGFSFAWLDPSFQYRTQVNISNPGSALTDYQVQVNPNIYNSTGLVGSWHFSEGSGTRAADSSGSNNDGTLANGPVWVSGKYGAALLFDGVNDYVDAGNAASARPTSALSIEAWVKVNTTGSTLSFIGAQSGTGWGAMIRKTSTNAVQWNMKIGGIEDRVVTSVSTLSTGVWYHLALTYNGSVMAGYINGVPDGAPLSVSGVINWDAAYNTLIGSGQGSNFMNGSIDEVRIYNRSLSAVEVQELYNASKARLDYADIRFALANDTQLPYWLESDRLAWVKVPNVSAAGNTTIYMYYGNPSAASASNDTNTFVRVIDGAQPVKGAWGLDGNALDASGNNNNGAMVNSSLNVLVGGTASAISNFDGVQLPNLAVDSNEATYWRSNDGPAASWWKYDLGAGVTKKVEKLRVSNQVNAAYLFGNFKVQGSNDNSVWTDLYSGNMDTGSYAWQEHTWSNSVGYRYYRVLGTSGNSQATGTVIISEFQMMELGPSFAAGKFGNGLQFDGLDDNVDAGNSASLDSAFDGSYTVAMWMKASSAEALKGLFEKRDAANGAMMAFFNYPSAGKVKFYSGSNVDSNALDSMASDLNNGSWRHLVFQLDGTVQRIYVDGALDNSRTKVSGTSSDGAFRIGRLSTTYFNGAIDEVRVYNRALTQAEITDLYSNYGYVTLNYPGRELVRKYVSSEPTVSSGSQEQAELMPPSVLVQSPNASVTYSSVSVLLNFTASDSSGISQCKYELNGLNSTLAGCQNTTITAVSGPNSLTVWAYDGTNWGSASVSFNVSLDTTPPGISISSPENKSYSSMPVPVNFVASDPSLGSCAVRLNGTLNSSSCSNYSLSLGNGVYTLNITANDTSGNLNSSAVSFTVDLTVSVSNSTITNAQGIGNVSLNGIPPGASRIVYSVSSSSFTKSFSVSSGVSSVRISSRVTLQGTPASGRDLAFAVS